MLSLQSAKNVCVIACFFRCGIHELLTLGFRRRVLLTSGEVHPLSAPTSPVEPRVEPAWPFDTPPFTRSRVDFPAWHGGRVAFTRLHPLGQADLLIQRAVAGRGADAQLRNFKLAQNAR